jgi:hypothetical protein
MSFYRSDSPGPEWYEAPDPIEIEDDELVDVPHEALVIGAGIVSWSFIDDTDD